MTNPTGREPSLPIDHDISGREPALGKEALRKHFNETPIVSWDDPRIHWGNIHLIRFELMSSVSVDRDAILRALQMLYEGDGATHLMNRKFIEGGGMVETLLRVQSVQQSEAVLMDSMSLRRAIVVWLYGRLITVETIHPLPPAIEFPMGVHTRWDVVPHEPRRIDIRGDDGIVASYFDLPGMP